MADPLRSYEEFQKSFRFFESWIGGAAPGATDIDCLIERRGNFLVLESKPWAGMGVVVGLGQHLALTALARLQEVDVWLIGESASGERYVTELKDGNVPRVRRSNRVHAYYPADLFQAVSVEQLQAKVRGWWDEASRS